MKTAVEEKAAGTPPTYEESEKGSLDLSRTHSRDLDLFAQRDGDVEANGGSGREHFRRPLKTFGVSLATITALCLILISVLAEQPSLGDEHVATYYYFLSGVLIMVYVGFGFLMTFLRKYSLSAVSLNFVLSAMMTLVAIVTMGFEKSGFGRFPLDIPLLIDATFCAAAGMISFGAVIGFATPTQLAWLLFFEAILYAANVYLTVHVLHAVDTGGSITIHAFGAFYGLAASFFLSRTSKTTASAHPKNGASPRSDLTSMIGTLFLWIFWPSFNAALASDGEAPITEQHQFFVVSNTLLSLLGSTLATFALSTILNGSLDMVHIQNATLAGGVAIGSAAALKIAPGAALGVGLVAGIISTLGFSYSTAFFERLLGLADTCGVQNLHGAPGVVGGFASAILVAVYAQENADMLEHSGSHQAGMQVAGLLATIAVAGAGGLVCGALVGYTNLPAVGGEPVDIEELYDDAALIKGD